MAMGDFIEDLRPAGSRPDGNAVVGCVVVSILPYRSGPITARRRLSICEAGIVLGTLYPESGQAGPAHGARHRPCVISGLKSTRGRYVS
jgi:hypothetical protein